MRFLTLRLRGLHNYELLGQPAGKVLGDRERLLASTPDVISCSGEFSLIGLWGPFRPASAITLLGWLGGFVSYKIYGNGDRE